jgi:regulator of protease activity HflC (stomatin/prohibitin superfamily)
MVTTSGSNPLLFVCVLGICLFVLVLLIISAIRIVPENARLSVFRLGHYIGDKGPGVVLLIPTIDRALRVNVSDQVQRAQAQQQMWGVIGETQTAVHTDGHVEISGQIWSAVSHEPLPEGTKVRVVKVILEVERLAE